MLNIFPSLFYAVRSGCWHEDRISPWLPPPALPYLPPLHKRNHPDSRSVIHWLFGKIP